MILDTFWFAINAILPIVMLITLGFYLKKLGFVDLSLIKTMNQYVFKIALPLLFFYNIYQTESLRNIDFSLQLFIIIAAILVFAIGFFLPLAKLKEGQTAVVHMSLSRTNFAMIGMTLATLIGDPYTVALVSLTAIFIVPLNNALNIFTLSSLNDQHGHKRLGVKETLVAILKNPLQVGVMAAIVLVMLKTFLVDSNGTAIILIERDVPFVYTTIRTLSLTASPIALIALGAQFEFHALKQAKKAVMIAVAFRNIIIPAVMVTLTVIMIQYNEQYQYLFPSVIAVFATPVAISSVVLVDQLGGDTDAAGQIVVWTTLLSSVTLFVIISVLRILGYL
ncbi:MAG: AEC family transporter [Acholeplasmataceae bacterium]